MKKLIVIIVILLVTITALSLSISGCARDKPGDIPSRQTEPPGVKKHNATLIKMTAPRHFVPMAKTPAGSLFGMSGNKMMLWDAAADRVTTLGDAWEAVLSPNGKKIAYTDQKGLNIMDLDTGNVNNISIPAAKEDLASMQSVPSLGTWFESSDRFLYMFLYEWTSDYYIYDCVTGESDHLVFEGVPDFLSVPVGMLGEKLLFIVHAPESRDGKREYRENGYRSNLVVSDDKGSVTPLTDLDDGEFILYGGATRDSNTILILIRDETGKTSAGLLDPDSGNIKTLPAEGNIVAGSISPNGKFAVFIMFTDGGQMKAMVLELQGMEIIMEEEISGSEPSRQFVWEDDGSAVYFGTREENGDGVVYTLNIN